MIRTIFFLGLISSISASPQTVRQPEQVFAEISTACVVAADIALMQAIEDSLLTLSRKLDKQQFLSAYPFTACIERKHDFFVEFYRTKDPEVRGGSVSFIVRRKDWIIGKYLG